MRDFYMEKEAWRSLSLREKIGQTVIFKGNPKLEIEKFGSLDNFLRKYPVGGFFVGGDIINTGSQTVQNVLQATSEYSKVSKTPLLFASDFENGAGSMIRGLKSLPDLMALGAANNEELAYDYGKVTALDAKKVAISLTFSPVADLNQNRHNQVTNLRSVSDKPEIAIKLLPQVVKGMQEHGLAATVKHFPGDGTDERDQHMVTTENNLSMEEWYENHGKVFKKLIDDGVSCIMTGHIALPAYQKERIEERCLPATLSKELTTGLLKEELGFKGVVISDALDMGGFLGWYPREQAEIECFKTGTDMLLWPGMNYIDLMEKAIITGEVSMERLDDAVARIWELKERLGLFSNLKDININCEDKESIFISQTAQKVAEKSITLLRDRNKYLPLEVDKVKRVLIIGITHHDAAFKELKVLKEELKSKGIETDIRRNITIDELKELEGQYDLILYGLYNRPHGPIGPLDFFGDEARSIWASLTRGKEKSIVVSFGSPYHFSRYFDAANVYINTYSICEDTQKALVKALFGEMEFTGNTPVKI
jgi:beta-N-acetylhexosaminidase